VRIEDARQRKLAEFMENAEKFALKNLYPKREINYQPINSINCPGFNPGKHGYLLIHMPGFNAKVS
jgi:hypothetical protein